MAVHFIVFEYPRFLGVDFLSSSANILQNGLCQLENNSNLIEISIYKGVEVCCRLVGFKSEYYFSFIFLGVYSL